jgi:hypothetical protein
MRSSNRAFAYTSWLIVVAVLLVLPAAGRSEASKKQKPVGKLVDVLADAVFIGTLFVTEGGPNLYAFVGNNPINAYDALGMEGTLIEEEGAIVIAPRKADFDHDRAFELARRRAASSELRVSQPWAY